METIRAPNNERALADYQAGMKYKDIAVKYGVTINTVKSWKTRYSWSKVEKKGVRTKKEKVCTQKGGQPGNINAVGHGAPLKNNNAEKHGFFSRYLPEETFSIIQEIERKNPIDVLWENIQIAYAAIIRAQKIMYVKDSKDKSTTQIQRKDGDSVTEERWEVQQAWDKQASFLKAQSRAQGELRSLIKQYDEMINRDWGLATDEQKARIEMLKAQANKITGDNTEIEDLADVEADVYGSD